jgi:hypothetical protein
MTRKLTAIATQSKTQTGNPLGSADGSLRSWCCFQLGRLERRRRNGPDCLSVSAPRTVHALVAGLVQVANTPATPVPTTDASKLAAQNIQLVCGGKVVGPCLIEPPTGGFLIAWTVPSGQNFVITDVEVRVNQFGLAGVTSYSITWTPHGDSFRTELCYVLSNGTTTESKFANGIVFRPGSTVISQGGGNTQLAIIRGYLTPT